MEPHNVVDEVSVSLHKSASQSTDTDHSRLHAASRSVDGNITPLISSNSCSHPTEYGDRPVWWMADLGQSYNITGVSIVQYPFNIGM